MAFNRIGKNIENLMQSALTSPSPKNGAELLEQFHEKRVEIAVQNGDCLGCDGESKCSVHAHKAAL
jgi:hypothetical protein